MYYSGTHVEVIIAFRAAGVVFGNMLRYFASTPAT